MPIPIKTKVDTPDVVFTNWPPGDHDNPKIRMYWRLCKSSDDAGKPLYFGVTADLTNLHVRYWPNHFVPLTWEEYRASMPLLIRPSRLRHKPPSICPVCEVNHGCL